MEGGVKAHLLGFERWRCLGALVDRPLRGPPPGHGEVRLKTCTAAVEGQVVEHGGACAGVLDVRTL